MGAGFWEENLKWAGTRLYSIVLHVLVCEVSENQRV